MNALFRSVTPTKEEDASRIRREAEIKVEDVIREVIEHFKKDDPRGLPGKLVGDAPKLFDVIRFEEEKKNRYST